MGPLIWPVKLPTIAHLETVCPVIESDFVVQTVVGLEALPSVKRFVVMRLDYRSTEVLFILVTIDPSKSNLFRLESRYSMNAIMGMSCEAVGLLVSVKQTVSGPESHLSVSL